MEQVVNIPIQMICCISTCGEFTPIRFRFEDDGHRLITVHVSSVLFRKDTAYNGIREIQYLCRSETEGNETMFLLKYRVDSHKWILFKTLN